MSVSCAAFSQEWSRDPALEVICPNCNAQIGKFCAEKRPSGYRIRFGSTLIHPARDQLAMDLGFLQKCPAATIPVQTDQQLTFL